VIVGVIGNCSVKACSRPASRHIELVTAEHDVIAGVVCEHCALATSAAVFLLDLIA
jgi:hypothetical protein